jgi:UDP-glucuronate 4-epimerase
MTNTHGAPDAAPTPTTIGATGSTSRSAEIDAPASGRVLPAPDGRPIVITGAAGFIGHHTARLLLDHGHPVIGVDSFTPYYDRATKEQNLALIADDPGFELIEADGGADEVAERLHGCRALIHLAAQPGVRDSWRRFDDYVRLNVQTTKRLLDAAVAADVPRVVCASSSSVYGNAPSYPTSELDLTEPCSPYGITKLATERLAVAYAEELDLPTVSMRYFTVYGPGQRPDMAIQRLIVAADTDQVFPLYGDGTQIRDFTFVGDVAWANALAALAPRVPVGAVLNVCSQSPVTLHDVIEAVERATGSPVRLDRRETALGDVRRTGGNAEAIDAILGWHAEESLTDGIAAQVNEFRRRQRIGQAA